MLPKQNSLERIPEYLPVNLNVNSETKLEELDEKMKVENGKIHSMIIMIGNNILKIMMIFLNLKL